MWGWGAALGENKENVFLTLHKQFICPSMNDSCVASHSGSVFVFFVFFKWKRKKWCLLSQPKAVSQQPEMNEWITVIKGQGNKLRQIIAQNFICSRWRNLYDSS